jgi:translation initiation factor 1
MKNKNSQLVFSTDPEARRQIEKQQKSAPHIEAINLPPEKQQIKIALQTKRRKGKQVTMVQGFQHDTNTLNDLARKLKQFCSAGGTVKEQSIEIQGDKKKIVAKKLEQLGYQVRLI